MALSRYGHTYLSLDKQLKFLFFRMASCILFVTLCLRRFRKDYYTYLRTVTLLFQRGKCEKKEKGDFPVHLQLTSSSQLLEWTLSLASGIHIIMVHFKNEN